ncbi:DUF759 family protein [Borreliella burgdorferi]|uniref:DUF759 family protein n=2 Tax=Borreliella burgdorferi TaxID=139 RepID=UPI00017F488F|nr:DUF759 family protein [Borreliella burgdorferi]ACN56272.1 conserved hypothetical protein [Borreliella burgdorferi CA-11.2A]MCD2387558.1 DUF759 family protein [Borreliella burgdorferi]MCD2390883.1 DUF759 family protein [Borreliella burgdorferi]
MSDKFTIKFKGILDHAATKKAIEQDISKMGKYLKPRNSSLGSTKDIVKNNLSDKKKELSRQSKFESLRERVEKYRLTQTKKLMKQGMGFEKARKEAFRRSLMSDKDKRRLEYKELAKESKAKSKMLATSQGKGLVAKIAIGSALGNIISNAMSKVGGGLLGFAKKAVEEDTKTKRTQLLNKAFYGDPEEKKSLLGILGRMKGFERNLEKEEFLNQASVFKGTLRDLDMLNETNLKNAVEFAAMLKSSGAMSSEDAVKAVNSVLGGDGSELFELLKKSGVGDKYIEDAKMAWQSGAQVDLESRITKMMEMFKDFKSFGLTKKANTAESIQSNLASAEQTLQNLTTTVLEPILDLIKKITNYFKDFTFQTHVVQPFFKGLKSLFAKLPVVGKFFRDNPESVPNPPKPKPENNQNQDNANSTP